MHCTRLKMSTCRIASAGRSSCGCLQVQHLPRNLCLATGPEIAAKLPSFHVRTCAENEVIYGNLYSKHVPDCSDQPGISSEPIEFAALKDGDSNGQFAFLPWRGAGIQHVCGGVQEVDRCAPGLVRRTLMLIWTGRIICKRQGCHY